MIAKISQIIDEWTFWPIFIRYTRNFIGKSDNETDRCNREDVRNRPIWIFSFRTMPRLAERICNFCGSVRRGANSNKLSDAAARRRVSGNRERTNNSKLRGKPERGILCVCLTFANLLKNLAVVSKRPSVRNISKLELHTSSRFRLFLRFSNWSCRCWKLWTLILNFKLTICGIFTYIYIYNKIIEILFLSIRLSSPINVTSFLQTNCVSNVSIRILKALGLRSSQIADLITIFSLNRLNSAHYG